MQQESELTIEYAGQHLSMVRRGNWEFTTRNTKRPAVGIVAITDAGKVVLVEQYRPPAGRRVVEIPAGLAGDLAGREGEAEQEESQRPRGGEGCGRTAVGDTCHDWTPHPASH